MRITKMETRRDFYKILAKRLKGDPNAENIANCHGYSLFVCGEKDEERYVSKYSSPFDELSKSNKAYLGYLALWRNKDGFISHSGIVRNVNPLVISNRREVSGIVFNKDTLESLSDFYQTKYPEFKFFKHDLEFRIPSKLQNIINAENQN